MSAKQKKKGWGYFVVQAQRARCHGESALYGSSGNAYYVLLPRAGGRYGGWRSSW